MPSQFGLKSLIDPLPIRRFQREYWAKKPWVAHHSARWLRAVCAGLRFDSLRDLVDDSRAVTTKLWYASRETTVPIGEARRYYEQGVTLFFNRFDPLARSWHEKLASDLDLPSIPGGSGSVPSIFASPAGHGSALHFDRFEIFTIQLFGTKQWRIAPASVPYPTTGWAPGDPYPSELDAYRDRALAPPSRSQRIILRPGSVMYLPRGYWHETEADASTESASLNFAFGPPTKADVLVAMLRFLVERDPFWRTWSARREDRKRLEQTLAELAHALPDLADDFLGSRSGARFRRNRLATLSLGEPTRGGKREAAVIHRGAARTVKTIALSRRDLAVCEYLSRRSACSISDIVANVRGVRRDHADRLIEKLIAANYITAVSSR